MAIPMNNTLGNSSRERALRLYNKNVELENKRRKAAQAKIPSDPNTWQQMRENYESILLEDYAFSEKHDIEYALWQLHYKRIEELRAHYAAAQASAAQNAKSQAPARPGVDRITKIRSQFKAFLSEATGFYHDLMVKIRAKHGLSLGYMSEDSQNDNGSKSVDVKKGVISCHRCFIYLGDLARYKGLYGEGDSKTRDFETASSYYYQAATLWPSSGNPHHQLAILASYSGDELLAVYRYFRSLAVDTPFTTARDNLIIAFEKNRQSYCQLLGDSKPAPNKNLPARMAGKGRNKGETRVPLKDRKTEPSLVEERELNVPETLKAFSIRFVRLNGILFTRTSLETFDEVFSMARTEFLQLLSSGHDEMLNFGSDFNECKLYITRFIAVIIFTVYNANKETENQSYTEILQRSVVLQNAFTAIFDFMAIVIDRCFKLKDPSGSFLLPGIMIFVEWLACCQDVVVAVNEMEEKQAAARSLFWNGLVSFLNKMMSSSSSSGSRSVNESEDETCFFNMSRYDESETTNRLALPEDVELRGFLPLVPAHVILDFSHFGSDGNKEKNARVQRIVAAGKALAANVHDGKEGIYFDSKCKKFFFGVEPQKVNEIEEEEDEVIVFKPSMPEKLMSSSEVASSANGNTQYSQLANGFSDLNLSGNGFPASFEMQSTAQTIGFNAYNERIQDPETVIPSKFDSVMTSAPGFDSIPSKTKSVKSVGWNKSPVSRPVRHFGPPPGFNSKNENPIPNPNPNLNLNSNSNLNPVLDDYSWLDGYQLPYSGYRDGFGNSLNCLPQPNKLLNTNRASLGMETFPFPGKQVSPIGKRNGNGNGNGWLDYQIPEHSSLYQEPVIKKGNEQFIALPQQYQGQSLWEGRFFV